MVRISKQNLSPSTNSFVADSLLEKEKQTIRLTAWVEPWDTALTLTSLATLVGVTAVGWMLRNELTTAFLPSMDYEQTFLLGRFMFNIQIFENIYLITMKRKTLCPGWAGQRKWEVRSPLPKRAPEEL